MFFVVSLRSLCLAVNRNERRRSVPERLWRRSVTERSQLTDFFN